MSKKIAPFFKVTDFLKLQDYRNYHSVTQAGCHYFNDGILERSSCTHTNYYVFKSQVGRLELAMCNLNLVICAALISTEP